MPNFNEETRKKITQSRNFWLVDDEREPYRFNDYYGRPAEINVTTLCVPAIHTKHSTEYKPDGKHFIYTYGDDSRHWAVSQNGYMVSFESADLKPKRVGTADPETRYVTVFGSTKTREIDDAEIETIREPTEKLHRVVWYSFCANAIKMGEEQPIFVIEDPETQEIIAGNRTTKLSMTELKSLMRQPSKDHDGHPAPYDFEYVVHHIDKDKSHNNIENLELMPWWLHDMTEESIHKIAQGWTKEYGKTFGKSVVDYESLGEIAKLFKGTYVLTTYNCQTEEEKKRIHDENMKRIFGKNEE